MTKPQLNIPLKPCPFKQDGETHEVQVLPQGSGYPETWQVVCSCGACGPIDLGESGACDSWNHCRWLEYELLDVIVDAADFVKQYDEPCNGIGRRLYGRLWTALAKARGEA